MVHRQLPTSLATARRTNLAELMALFGTRSAFCARFELSNQQVGNYYTSRDGVTYKPMGEKFTRAMEARLELPQGALDNESGVADLLAGVVARFELANPRTSPSRARQLPVAPVGEPGLSPLQTATLDSVRKAMRDGRFSDAECLALLNRWTVVQP